MCRVSRPLPATTSPRQPALPDQLPGCLWLGCPSLLPAPPHWSPLRLKLGAPNPQGQAHVSCECSQLSTFWVSSSGGNFPAGGGRLFWKVPGGAAPALPPGSHAPLSLGARGAQCCACLAPPQLTSLVLPPPPFPSSPQGTLAPPAWLRQALLLQVGKLRPRSAPSNTPCEPGREWLVGSMAQERGGGGDPGWRT